MNIKDLFLVTTNGTLNYLDYSTGNNLTPAIKQATFEDYNNSIEVQNDGTITYPGLFKFLSDNATNSNIKWNKTLPNGVSKTEHYNSLVETLTLMSQLIYKNTKRFKGSKFIISANLTPVFRFIDGFKSEYTITGGIYKYGTINSDLISADVYVSPELKDNEIICVAKSADEMSAGLGISFKDDKYAIKVLNSGMIIKCEITNE